MNPAEILALMQVFEQLEPEAQKGVASLIHLFHKKPPTAADYITEAQALLAKAPPVIGVNPPV